MVEGQPAARTALNPLSSDTEDSQGGQAVQRGLDQHGIQKLPLPGTASLPTPFLAFGSLSVYQTVSRKKVSKQLAKLLTSV